MFLNLPEIVTWMETKWVKAQRLSRPVEIVTARLYEEQTLAEQIEIFKRTSVLVYPHGATMAHAVFLPRGAVAIEVIPWHNVTEPHGWLQSIKRQYELDEVALMVMVNKYRDHMVLNWHVSVRPSLSSPISLQFRTAAKGDGFLPS